MKLVTVCWIWIAVAFVVLGVVASDQGRAALSKGAHSTVTDSVIDLPGYGNDDDCDENGDDDSDESTDEIQGCSITRAKANLDGLPTLILDGQFCEEPTVWLGTAGGNLEPLFVSASGPTFVEADLASWTDSATRIVVVECPCAACIMDVTIGAAGPPGPEGPQGPAGPPGPPGPAGEMTQGLMLPLRMSVRTVTHDVIAGDDIQCFSAACSAGERVTGGGFTSWSSVESVEGLSTGFELASSGPYRGTGGTVFGPPEEMPASPEWIVCGEGGGPFITVYAVCLLPLLPVCGDGEVVAPETCESTDDCLMYGPDAECVDCNCTGYCGDGVVTPPEECDDGAGNSCDGVYVCENCACVPWDDGFPGGGD